MVEQQFSLLRIMDGAQVVAEAPLIIHDTEKAWQLFLETFPALSANIAGSVFQVMLFACNDEFKAKLAGQPMAALMIAKSSPITLAGQMPNNGRGG